MTRSSLVVVGAVLWLWPGSAPAQAAARANTIAFPGGIADAAGDSAYVDAAAGGVEAIALASGGVRWHNRELARPIAVARGRVVALVPTRKPYELRLAVVDAATGKVTRMSDGVVLPGWVSIAPAYAHTFSCIGQFERDRVVVWWHATAAWSQGMHPRDGQEEAAQRDAAGAVEVALETGRARAVADRPPAPLTEAPLASVLADRYKIARRVDTSDRRHVLVKDGASWIVFERSSGRRVGTLLGDEVTDALVIGDRLFVSPKRSARSVQAVDLKTGKVRWEHALATPPLFPPRP